MTFTTINSGLPIISINDSLVAITSSTFQIDCYINPNGLTTTSYFEYGTTSSLGNILASVPSSVSGTNYVAVNSTTFNLTVGVTFYFRLVATNSLGTVYSSIFAYTP